MKQEIKMEFLRSLFKLRSFLNAEFGKDSKASNSSINIPEYILMREIAVTSASSNSNTTLSDIREYLSITKAAVSQILRSLENKGLIIRDVDKNDRRNLIITITPEGQEMLRIKDEEFNERFNKITNALGESDITQMIEIINRMSKTLSQIKDQQKQGGGLMKVAIVYYSQHHGNTKKLLDAIKELYDVKLINVVECKKEDLSNYDVIGFASGTYYSKFSEKVMDFARNNLPNKKQVFLINTYGIKGNYTKEIEQIITEKSCRLIGTYGCRGFDTFGPFKLIGGIAKGHPNERDVKGAIEFFRRIVEK
jgi:DNA-binding MarR family transcriptional regulator/flavodoxin